MGGWYHRPCPICPAFSGGFSEEKNALEAPGVRLMKGLFRVMSWLIIKHTVGLQSANTTRVWTDTWWEMRGEKYENKRRSQKEVKSMLRILGLNFLDYLLKVLKFEEEDQQVYQHSKEGHRPWQAAFVRDRPVMCPSSTFLPSSIFAASRTCAKVYFK